MTPHLMPSSSCIPITNRIAALPWRHCLCKTRLLLQLKPSFSSRIPWSQVSCLRLYTAAAGRSEFASGRITGGGARGASAQRLGEGSSALLPVWKRSLHPQAAGAAFSPPSFWLNRHFRGFSPHHHRVHHKGRQTSRRILRNPAKGEEAVARHGGMEPGSHDALRGGKGQIEVSPGITAAP